MVIVVLIIVAVVAIIIFKSPSKSKLKAKAEQGDVQAQYDYAVKCGSGNEAIDEAIEWCQKAAENNHAKAIKKLAELREIKALPICDCQICVNHGRRIRPNDKYALLVDTPEGARLFCCSWCKAHAGYGRLNSRLYRNGRPVRPGDDDDVWPRDHPC